MTTDRLSILSRERVSEEIQKGFEQAQKPEVYFDLLMDSGVLPKLIPEFGAYTVIFHDNRGAHYFENLQVHTHDVLSRLPTYCLGRSTDQGYSNFLYLKQSRIAAMLHDIGKVFTEQIDGEKIRFVGHDEVGIELARQRLAELRFPSDLITYVSTLIRYHMVINNLRGESERTVKRKLARLFIDLGEDSIIFDLLDLCEADSKTNLAPMRAIVYGFKQPALIRGRDVIDYEPRIRGKLLRQMRFIQFTQDLDESQLRKIIAGEAHNIVN